MSVAGMSAPPPPPPEIDPYFAVSTRFMVTTPKRVAFNVPRRVKPQVPVATPSLAYLLRQYLYLGGVLQQGGWVSL